MIANPMFKLPNDEVAATRTFRQSASSGHPQVASVTDRDRLRGEGAKARQAFERLAIMLAKLGAQREVMPPVQIDGFVAAFLVLTERVPIREWLPCMFGPRTTVDDNAEAADMEAALMRH